MPFIAFDFDALDYVPHAACAAGVPVERVSHGLLNLWKWCWRAKSEEVDAIHLRGFFGSDIAEGLAAFGFLEALPEGRFRVCGAEKYLRIRRSRSAGGHASKRNLLPGGKKAAPKAPETTTTLGSTSAPAEPQPSASPSSTSALQLAANSEQRTALKNVRTPPEESAPRKEAHVPRAVTPPEGEPANWSWEDFWRWAQWKRGRAGLPVEQPPRPEKASAWWSAARSTHGAEDIQTGFLAFGDDPYWQKQAPPLPFAGFMKQWDRFVRGEVAHAS